MIDQQIESLFIFQNWFLVMCIAEFIIYMVVAIYVSYKLKGILCLRNYIIILAFGCSLGLEIVFVIHGCSL